MQSRGQGRRSGRRRSQPDRLQCSPGLRARDASHASVWPLKPGAGVPAAVPRCQAACGGRAKPPASQRWSGSAGPGEAGKMDPVPSLGCSLKDVKWSPVAVPLDLLVSTYRLPQIARLDSGEYQRGARVPGRVGPGRGVVFVPSRLLGLRGCRSPGALLFIPPSSSSHRQRGANQNPCSV
ncbi:GRB2-associated and regulator of MAPK protein [Lemmus lemmus]